MHLQYDLFHYCLCPVPIREYCTGIVCENGGTCVNKETGFKCQCSDQFTGQTCQDSELWRVNEVGDYETFSSHAGVLFATLPQFIKQPKSSSHPLYSSLMLECSVTGIPTPRIVWYKDSTPISDGDDDDSVFTIRELALPDRGFYHCEARNAMGRVNSSVAVVNIDGESR